MTGVERRAEIRAALSTGRDNAISVAELCGQLDGTPGRSTVRRYIRGLQRRGWPVLSSPRDGVWLADGDAERLDVIDELRERISALEARIFDINGDRCALRTCRDELPESVRKRRGLYCRPEHRYLAATKRKSR